MLIDETGCLLSPLVRRSLAPCGQTPTLKQKAARREKVSVIAGLSLSPQRRQVGLYFCTLPNANVNHEKAADFLCELLRQLRGNVIAVWDCGPMHHGPALRELQARFPRLTLESLPPYAPELNPVEYLWSHLKYTKLVNLSPDDAWELDDHVTENLCDIKLEHQRLRGFYKLSPLNTTLLF